MPITTAWNVAVTFNESTYTGDIQYGPDRSIVLVHADGEEEVLTISYASCGVRDTGDTVLIHDGGVRSGLAESLERAGIVEILRSIPLGFDTVAVEARVLLVSEMGAVLDQVITESGSVWDFAWASDAWPEEGSRPGHARKNGGTWTPIEMGTTGYETGSRLMWRRADGAILTTSRVVSARAITTHTAHAA